MNRTTPDFPIERYSLEELESLSDHITATEYHLRAALEQLGTDSCVGREQLARSYSHVVYTQTAITGCIRLKSRENGAGLAGDTR